MADVARAAARRRPQQGGFATPLAGGFATFTAPGSPVNKVAGVGFAGPLEPDALDAVERTYADRGVPVQFEVSCLADPRIGALLTGRGYALVNFENVLGLRLPAPPRAPAEGISVAESPAAERAAWLELVVTAFASPDAQGVPSHESFPRDELERVMDDMAEAEGFERYLARRAGGPAGGAALRVFDGVAQLCGAATLPAQRRRGVQGALLDARLESAGRSGCDVAVVTTQPGSKSQENVQRRGFELLYTRAILVRAR